MRNIIKWVAVCCTLGFSLSAMAEENISRGDRAMMQRGEQIKVGQETGGLNTLPPTAAGKGMRHHHHHRHIHKRMPTDEQNPVFDHEKMHYLDRNL